MAADQTNLALLIDGDNISHRYVEKLMFEVAKHGHASVRRIYSDWTAPGMKSWKECLSQYSITPMQQFAYSSGKNATDGFMIIDAMDLLYTARFSAFCIATSDSDFTRLATRIREQGIKVYGYGEIKTNRAFISACSDFTFLDAPRSDIEEALVSPERALVPQPIQAPESRKRPIDQAALEKIVQAMDASGALGDDEWVNLANIGIFLRRLSPDLKPLNYGFNRLRDFVEASGIVDVKMKDMGDSKPPIAFARLKSLQVSGVKRKEPVA